MHRMMKSEGVWDVAVIGGGPAGMMAAGTAAARGAKVILIEKNTSLGKKLLITGGGRCNVTNAEPDLKKLLARFKRGGKFLPSPFSQFDNASALAFFNERGMPTKVEAEQRAFPVSDDAHSVWDVLVRYMKDGGVTMLSNAPVLNVIAKSGHIDAVILKNKRQIRAKRFVFAMGGLSHPETGSTGDGFKFLRELGHTVSDTNAALVPLALHDTPLKRAAGVALKSAKITAYQTGAKQAEREGKMLFTHVGLSGPAVLNMSRDIGELLKYGEVVLEIDLLPEDGPEKVNSKLQEMLRGDSSNKMLKNVLTTLIPPGLVSPILEIASIDGETVCHSVTRTQRLTLAHLLKHVRVSVKSLLGLEKAIITSGGVALDEIDWKTMRSLKYDNLYIAGDLLDIDRPSGGYSLQLCWTTGFVAGNSTAEDSLN